MENPVIDSIVKRRTIKPEDCTGEKISEQHIQQVLETANWAPTHGYTEPWRFVIFADNGLTKFAQDHAEMYKKHTPADNFKQVKYQKLLDRAKLTSHIIAIICKKGNNPKIPFWEEMAATACAVQNMQLAAASLGIAAYWNSGGMTAHPEMKTYLGYSEDDFVMGFLYLGIPVKDKEFKGRRISSIQEKVNWVKE